MFPSGANTAAPKRHLFEVSNEPGLGPQQRRSSMSPVLSVIRSTKKSIASHFNSNFSKRFRLILMTAGIVTVAAISLTSIVESSYFGWKAQPNRIKSEDSFARSNHPFVGAKETNGHVTVQAAG